MKNSLKPAILLPIAALVINFALIPLLPLTPSAKDTAWATWGYINKPVELLVWITYPVTEAVGVNWGWSLSDKVETVGSVLLWFGVGLLIGRRRAELPANAPASSKFTPWRALTFLLILVFGVFLVFYWYEFLEFLRADVFDTRLAIHVLIAGTILATWSVLLVSFCIRNFEFVTTLVEGLFRFRPEASWKGYLPLIIIPPLLVSDTFEMIALTTIALVLIRYRTLAGWLLLLGWSLRYSALATISVAIMSLDGYNLIIVACGLLPSITLIACRPRLRSAAVSSH